MGEREAYKNACGTPDVALRLQPPSIADSIGDTPKLITSRIAITQIYKIKTKIGK